MITLDKIKELLGVTTDKALSEKLGHKSPATVGNWRARGKVPQKVIREWALTYDKPYVWFLGLKEQKAEPDHYKTPCGMVPGGVEAGGEAKREPTRYDGQPCYD